MRPGQLSDWSADAFGEHVDVLRTAIPVALTMAHTRARAGHDATQSKNLRVYGTALWEFQHEELVAATTSIAGARVAKFGGYELPVVANHVLFPLRYTDRAGIPVERACLPVPVSRQRQRLFGAHAPEVERANPFLDESWAELDLPADYEVFPQLGDDTELIVIAYACSLEAGVLHIEWGRAEHIGGGELRWGEHTPLPLVLAEPANSVTGRNQLSSTGQRTAGSRFDAGVEPGIALDLRHPADERRNVPPQTERHPDEPRTQDDDRD
ncbi:MAG: hypothetical protein ACRDTC_04640 [Pseudonocardiaceae bacterium]